MRLRRAARRYRLGWAWGAPRAAALACLAWLALGTVTAQSNAELMLVDVAPLSVPCSLPPPWAPAPPTDAEASADCLVVRPLGERQWMTLPRALPGFEPHDGHGYRLLLRSGPGADARRASIDDLRLVAVLESVPLGDVRWRIEAVEVADEQLDLDGEAHLLVDAGAGRIAGYTGCNAFSGSARVPAPGRIDLGPAGSTRRACEAPRMRQERLVLEALASAERYASVGGRLRLTGAGGVLWLTPQLPADPTAAGRVWGDGELACFDQGVAAAAASGGVWTSDPLSVALALWTPLEAPQLDVLRRDTEPEGAPYSVVSAEARGFLDDSVAGWRRVALLERQPDGRWRVVAATEATRCARGEASWIGPPDLCP